MAGPIRIPDPQHIELEALYDAIFQAVEDGLIDSEELSYLHDGEPESHVFGSEDYDGYDDYDEAREIFMEVGSRDLDDKIRYWRRVIGRINGSLTENC